MNAKIYCLSWEVREAALDLKAIRTKIKESSNHGYEWVAAEATARRRMVALSLAQGEDCAKRPAAPQPHPKPGARILKLA
jgi:hypothetical protein